MLMNKFLLIFLIISLTFLGGCTETPHSTINFPTDIELTTLVENAMSENSLTEINIIEAEIVANFEEENIYVVLANIHKMGFIPKDGIFAVGSGAMFPVEIHFENIDGSFEVSDIIYPMDGSEFLKSLNDMSRNNVLWYKKLLESQNSYDKVYNTIIIKLEEYLQENEINGYIHKIDEIPGYTENIIQLKSLKNEPSGNIGIARKEDYEKAKREIGTVNWPHYKGILYNKQTGISVERFFDEFPFE